MADDVKVIFGANITGLVAGVEQIKGEIEGLNSMVGGITSTFTEVGEAVAAAFAVERLASFVEHLADMGSQLESTSAQLGFSTEKTLALQYAAKIADVSIDQAARTIDRFYMSVQLAQSATSRQAAAFKALGINAAELQRQGVDLNTIFDMTAQSLGKFADGANKTTIIMDLFGNRSAQTVRLVNILSEGYGTLEEKTQALDAPTKHYLDTLQEMHVRIVDLETVLNAWKIGLADIGNFFVRAGEGAIEFVSIVAAAFDGLKQLFNMAMAEASDFTEGFYKVMTTPFGKGYFERVSQEWSTTTTNIKNDALKGAEGINQLIDKEMKLIDVLENPTLKDAGTRTTGPDAPHVVDPSTIKKDMEVWEEALHDMLYKKQLFGDQALQAELQFWQQKLAIVKKGSEDEVKVEEKIYQVEKTLNAERVRDTDKAEKEQARIYERFFNSFNSGLISMMKGTGTWRDFVTNAFYKVFENGLKMLEKMVAQNLAAEHAKTAATVAGNAARTASDTAAAKASSGGFGSAAISQIQGDAAKAYAGVYGWAAPVMGPLAAVPAAAAYVSVIAMEGLIPSFDVGTGYVVSDTMAKLHAGESVLTPTETMMYNQEGGSGAGGIHLNIYGGVNDAKSIKNLIMREGPTLQKSLQRQARLKNSELRK